MKAVEPWFNALWDDRKAALEGEKDVIKAMVRIARRQRRLLLLRPEDEGRYALAIEEVDKGIEALGDMADGVQGDIKEGGRCLCEDDSRRDWQSCPQAAFRLVGGTCGSGGRREFVGGIGVKRLVNSCGALNDARRLAIHHSSLLLLIMECVMVVIVKAMKNPRSALCKTSIMACADIFRSFGRLLLSSSTKEEAAFDNLDMFTFLS
uniref:Uncharacterized protein n=1 Tax=Ananas comosus var. bracteatus TaxID=296719 RepID=A0A6V7PC67_ANACO|nr:unnamed protein product [Ananas comosus var. bracteatus]